MADPKELEDDAARDEAIAERLNDTDLEEEPEEDDPDDGPPSDAANPL